MLRLRAFIVRFVVSSLALTFGVTPTTALADETHDTFVSTSLSSNIYQKRHKIDSEALDANRIIDIALPASFHQTAEDHRYPVIVVMDGELLFPMVSGMVHQMAANSQMPESIVIGIQNSAGTRRSITPTPLNREGKPYWFGGNEDQYLRFLSEEVLPFVEKQYRATEFRTIIGLSPTGQFALHAFWKAPKLFDATIAVNTANFKAVGYGAQDVFEKVSDSASSPEEGSRFLYISMPSRAYERNPAISIAYNSLTDKSKSWPKGTTRVKTESIQKSSYAATLPAIASALEFVFPANDWDPSYASFISDVDRETLANVKEYFANLSAFYGFTALPKGERFYNRNRLKRLGYVMLEQKRFAEAIEVFRYWIDLYPYSANAYDSLADAFAATGDKKAAIEAGLKAVSLATDSNDSRLSLFQSKLEKHRAQSLTKK